MPDPWPRIEAALLAGLSSIHAWARHGRRAGISLESVVMRRRALRLAWKTNNEQRELLN